MTRYRWIDDGPHFITRAAGRRMFRLAMREGFAHLTKEQTGTQSRTVRRKSVAPGPDEPA
jgi:hypothetical protein